MRLGILLFTPIFLLAGVTLHAQEAVNAPEPAAAADSAANAELKAQLKAELLSEIRAELSSEVKTAVSKEADKPSRLTVGGYGEAVMTRNFFSDNYLRYISPDKYKNDKSHGRFDLPHVVIYLGYDFGRGWSMGTEIEFEHGGTESAFETEFEEGGEYESEIERGGEVALEQFWLQKSFSPAFNLRLGHMIVPVGGTNQHHMPTEFFGVYRPEGENTILPCTWHETGISLWGRAGDWRYEVMFLPGLDSDRFGDNGWVSGGAGSPYEFKIANAYAGAFRIDNYSVPGLRLSLSGYAGNSFSNTLSANRTGADRYKDVKGTVMIGAKGEVPYAKVRVRLESTIGIYGTGLLDAISDSDLKAEYVRQEQNGVPLNPAIFRNGEWVKTYGTTTHPLRYTYALSRGPLQDAAGANAIWNITNVTRSDRRYHYMTAAYAEVASKDADVQRDFYTLFPAWNKTGDVAQDIYNYLMNKELPVEMSDEDYVDFMVWHRGLAVPAARNLDDADVKRGKTLFTEIGCATCHRPTWTTGDDVFTDPNGFFADGDSRLPRYPNQKIWPYSDMVQHRLFMVNDIRTGWCRTTPLWGRGLSEKCTGASDRLHDCRARTVIEAIMWHGAAQSDARWSVEKFRTLSKDDRDAVVEFIESI